MSDELRAETERWLIKRAQKVRARGSYGSNEHSRLAQMMKLERVGMSYADIAREVGLSHTRVSVLIKREQSRQETLAKK